MGWHSFNPMDLLAEGERGFREANHAKGWEIGNRPAIFRANGDPYFKRILCPDIVKSKGGKQTDGSARRSLRRLSERVEFCNGSISGGIESAARTNNETLLFGKPQILTRDPVGVQIAGPQDTCCFGKLGNSGDGSNSHHFDFT